MGIFQGWGNLSFLRSDENLWSFFDCGGDQYSGEISSKHESARKMRIWPAMRSESALLRVRENKRQTRLLLVRVRRQHAHRVRDWVVCLRGLVLQYQLEPDSRPFDGVFLFGQGGTSLKISRRRR